jgi:ABC-type polysaccharide/polyol phosphate export permease
MSNPTLTRLSSLGYGYDVLSTLVRRELRIRYKGSILGLLWAVLSPLGTVAVLHVLFSRILPLDIPHYAAFIYSGMLPWSWFQASVVTSAHTLIDNRDLVRKPFFPRLMLPGVVAGTNFCLYLLALPVLVALLLIEGVALSPALLLLPLVWVVLGLFSLACSVLVAALGVVVRDVQHLLGVGMLLWFYMTPIFYDPTRIAPDMARWLNLNPLTPIIAAHRQIVLAGQPPDMVGLSLAALVSAALLAGSVWLFRVLEDSFVEEV